MIVALGFGTVWGDETLTITGAASGHNAPWGTSYETGSGSSATSGSHSVSLAWSNVGRMSTGIQIKNASGAGFCSTSTPFTPPSTPSANNIIKSINITGKTNTSNIVLSCSSDGEKWETLSFTSGSALDVSENNYRYFKVTQETNYVVLTSIVVTYTAAVAHTVTFNAGSGTCGTTSLTEANPLAGITLPSASPSTKCSQEGWTFAGWAKASCTETVNKPKLYAASSTYYTGKNETLYAVYKLGDVYTIDFESASSSYTDWTFTTMTSNQSGSITAHGGSKYGTTGGSGTASITTKSTSSPKYIRFYVSKQSDNTTSSTWYVQTKAEGDKDWSNRKSQSATSVTKGSWTEVTQDLSSYSNIYVRIYYDGSTAVRNIDDVELSCALYNSNPDCTVDYFVDIMHDNDTISKQGTYSAPAALSDASKGSYCEGEHFHFLGWIEEQYVDDDGTLNDATKLKAPGASITADNKTFYAVWAKEEE